MQVAVLYAGAAQLVRSVQRNGGAHTTHKSSFISHFGI